MDPYTYKVFIYGSVGLIFDGRFTKAEYSFNNMYILRKDDYETDVFDENGDFKFTIECKECYSVGERIYAFDGIKNPRSIQIYDLEGNLIKTKEITGLRIAQNLFSGKFNENYLYFEDLKNDKDLIVDYDLNIIYKCEKSDYLVKDNHNEMYVCNSNNNRIYKVSTQEEFIIEKSLDENWKVLCIVDDKVVCTSYVEGKAHTIIADLNGEIIFTNECETHN